ncbi:MAG: CocE/NonD family hydrolase [Propionicimonas sp.]|uniref:CocE/NonD family hydrolase n=1 Tax=Propionicimonas sp. TaxID=1955623 RepID=UPI003D0B8C51
MATFGVQTGVMVPMRDGVRLATDVYLPDTRPAPVLLTRTPYDKDRVAAFSDRPRPERKRNPLPELTLTRGFTL